MALMSGEKGPANGWLYAWENDRRFPYRKREGRHLAEARIPAAYPKVVWSVGIYATHTAIKAIGGLNHPVGGMRPPFGPYFVTRPPNG